MNRIYSLFIIIIFIFIIYVTIVSNIYAQKELHQNIDGITLSDSYLKLELVTSGLDFPTSMAFLGAYYFLILEKNTGNVKRVANRTLLGKPLLHVNTAIKDEQGLLGIAVSKKENFYDAFFIQNKNLTHISTTVKARFYQVNFITKLRSILCIP